MPSPYNSPNAARYPKVGVGAWVPDALIAEIVRLDLKSSSKWRVFTTILLTWCRYGRCEARLTVNELAATTGLGKRTVQSALSWLINEGLIARVGRYKRFRVTICGSEGKPGSASVPALPKRNHSCASPTSIHVPVSKKNNGSHKPTFTDRQRHVINDVVKQVGDLLGYSAFDLTLPPDVATKLGLPVGTNYGMAMGLIEASNVRQAAGMFVRAMIELRRDPKVQGFELPSGTSS